MEVDPWSRFAAWKAPFPGQRSRTARRKGSGFHLGARVLVHLVGVMRQSGRTCASMSLGAGPGRAVGARCPSRGGTLAVCRGERLSSFQQWLLLSMTWGRGMDERSVSVMWAQNCTRVTRRARCNAVSIAALAWFSAWSSTRECMHQQVVGATRQV